MEAKGIENIKKLIKGICAFGNAGGSILEDGKVSISDIGALKYLVGAKDLLDVDVKALLEEFKDLDEQEKVVILSEIEAEFDIPQDEVEAKVEDAFALGLKAIDIYRVNEDYVKEIIAFIKSFKKDDKLPEAVVE